MKNEGYLMVDHRASPGIPEPKARRLGYEPSLVAEGKMFEAATYGCPHCCGTVVKNPLRTRERGFCWKCSSNVCDVCFAIMQEPDYVHLPVKKLADLVQSGKYTFSGSMGRPILKPTGG
jgi:hypothetical protein